MYLRTNADIKLLNTYIRKLANKYNLDYLPINKDDYQNFACQIDEVNLNGLFNVGCSLDYVNKDLRQNEKVAESVVYDDKSIETSRVIHNIDKQNDAISCICAVINLQQDTNQLFLKIHFKEEDA